MTPRLTIEVLPEGRVQAFDGSRTIVIGRDSNADVVVVGDRISRRHAVVRPGEAGWVVQDTSTNGTFSSGVRLSQATVAGAMVIQLGDARIGPEIRLSPGDRGLEVTGHRSPQPSVIRSGRPSTLGEFSSLHRAVGSIRIGRADDNDIVVPDLLVSRHHAELRPVGEGFEIVDLSSNNGVFVDGARVRRRARLVNGSIISVGHHLFRLWQGALEEYIDAGRINFAAVDLTVRASGRLLVDGVSFALAAGHLLAVLGPTGAGKSTLMKALIGSRPADEGDVLYNGRQIYTSYSELRNRIGYVPQDDLLHSQLTVRKALRYSASLRFSPDVSDRDRSLRVEEVMDELGLTERADLVVSKLSGGQRKRTSVAIELLTRPSLLVLDEPTSGLDPGYEKSVMDLLRSLADGGRTVITVTHSIQSLDRCDRILFLAPGGKPRSSGLPTRSCPSSRRNSTPTCFRCLIALYPATPRRPSRDRHPRSGT